MPASDFASFRYGAVQFPLGAGSNSTLQDVDPSLYWALAFWTNVLTTHIGARYAAEVAAIGGTFAATYPSLIAYTTPIDPVPYLQQEQFKFPLFAVYRRSEKVSRRTVTWSHDTTRWGVAYIMPPLTAGQRERLEPLLRAIPVVLANRTEQGFDPAFQGGAKVWSTAFAGLEDISFPEGEYGSFPGINDELFPAWTGTIEVNERQTWALSDFAPLTGVDTEIDLATPTDPNAADPTQSIKDFVDFKSDIKVPGPTG